MLRHAAWGCSYGSMLGDVRAMAAGADGNAELWEEGGTTGTHLDVADGHVVDVRDALAAELECRRAGREDGAPHRNVRRAAARLRRLDAQRIVCGVHVDAGDGHVL